MASIVSGAGAAPGIVAASRQAVKFLTSPRPDAIREPSGVTVAVIDGPYDEAALSGVLARMPVTLGYGACRVSPNTACSHGTFIIGILGARWDALIPGLCPDCRLLHVPLFADDAASSASVAELASAITVAVAAGAELINLSLAIQGDDTQSHPELAAALDLAEASGAIVVVAAGNQGRLAMGQLLSHPVTIPVAAVDGAHRPLPDSNFGPTISRRGVAAPGHEVLGYAPGGTTTVMSGTSVATAVATGTLALLWSARPQAQGRDLRAAVAQLGPRNGPIPPMLDPEPLLAALDNLNLATVRAVPPAERGKASYATLQGGATMKDENGLPNMPNYGAGSAAISGRAVTPAQGAGGCTCGGLGGVCTCGNGESPQSRFVYVLGSVDIQFPDQSISEELQTVVDTLNKKNKNRNLDPDPNKPLRDWYYRVLSKPEARYVARQVCWILKVEGQPAYYLALRDLHDLADLISCLGRPEDDLDLFVGSSNLVPVDECPGLRVPVLTVDYLSWFERDHLVEWLKTPSTTRSEKSKRKKASGPNEHDPNELFKKLMHSADNLGDTDEWRALNYLAVRYKPLYERYAEMVMAEDSWILDSVKVAASRLGREKRIVDAVFAFRQMKTGVVRKYFVRVDVSHLFPIIVNHIADYFDR